MVSTNGGEIRHKAMLNSFYTAVMRVTSHSMASHRSVYPISVPSNTLSPTPAPRIAPDFDWKLSLAPDPILTATMHFTAACCLGAGEWGVVSRTFSSPLKKDLKTFIC